MSTILTFYLPIENFLFRGFLERVNMIYDSWLKVVITRIKSLLENKQNKKTSTCTIIIVQNVNNSEVNVVLKK